MYEYEKKLKKSAASGAMVQRRSWLNCTPKILRCKHPLDDSKFIDTDVGIDSHVHIDGAGQTTGSDPYSGRDGIYEFLDGYKKGHIVNQKLGGPGEQQNLFPFSAGTNSWHEKKIESAAKSAYDEFLKNHLSGEKYYYHCWLTGDAITKTYLDYPNQVDDIQIHAEWHIKKPDGSTRAADRGDCSTFTFDADFDGSTISAPVGPSILDRRRMERLGGVDVFTTPVYGELKKLFGEDITLRKLLPEAEKIANSTKVSIDREARRNFAILIKWFIENWTAIQPVLVERHWCDSQMEKEE